jgi:repressor LexA
MAETITPLTRKQREIWGFIVDFWEEHGYSPTFQEVADDFGFRSLGTVADHINALRYKGWLEKGDPATARMLTPLFINCCPLCGAPQ